MLRKPIYHKSIINEPAQQQQQQKQPATIGQNTAPAGLNQKPKIEIPKFKALLKMIKNSETTTVKSRQQQQSQVTPVRHHEYNNNNINEFQTKSQYFESTPPDLIVKQQLTKPRRHHYHSNHQQTTPQQQQIQLLEPPTSNATASHLDAKTQKIITYRNLVKTTREKFKRNLIDYMNKRKEDKVVRNIGYRYPANLPALSRSTFRTQETNETINDDEKLMLAASEIFNEEFHQNSLNSKSLPNLNYNLNNKRLSADDNSRHIDVKLPVVLAASTATPSTLQNAPRQESSHKELLLQQQQQQIAQANFTTDKSLKEDSLFWSKYKTTINRRMKSNQIPPIQFNSNSSAKLSTTNFDSGIPSIAEEDFKRLYSDSKKYMDASHIFNYDSQLSRFKTPLSGSRQFFGEQSNDDFLTNSSESVLCTLSNRMSDVSIKYL